MIVKCPSCNARFRIPEDKIKPSGTKVRCGRCRSVFRVALSAQAQDDDAPEMGIGVDPHEHTMAGGPSPAPSEQREASDYSGSGSGHTAPASPRAEAFDETRDAAEDDEDWFGYKEQADDSQVERSAPAQILRGAGAARPGAVVAGRGPAARTDEADAFGDDAFSDWIPDEGDAPKPDSSGLGQSVSPGPVGLPAKRKSERTDDEEWSDAFQSAPPPRAPTGAQAPAKPAAPTPRELDDKRTPTESSSGPPVKVPTRTGSQAIPAAAPAAAPPSDAPFRWMATAFAILITVVGFLGYVAHKNGGVLDFGDLETMVAVAFKGHTPIADGPRVIRVVEIDGEIVEEPVPDGETVDISTPLEIEEVTQSFYVNADRLPMVLIQGRLSNQSDESHRRIFVGGRIYEDGEVVARTIAPVGAPATPEHLESLGAITDVPAMYATLEEDAAGLVIDPADASLFTLVFPASERHLGGIEGMAYDVEVVQTEHLGADRRWRRIAYTREYAQP